MERRYYFYIFTPFSGVKPIVDKKRTKIIFSGNGMGGITYNKIDDIHYLHSGLDTNGKTLSYFIETTIDRYDNIKLKIHPILPRGLFPKLSMFFHLVKRCMNAIIRKLKN